MFERLQTINLPSRRLQASEARPGALTPDPISPIAGGWFIPFNPAASPLDRPALWKPADAPCVLRLHTDTGTRGRHSSRIVSEYADGATVHSVVQDRGGRHRLCIETGSDHTALLLPLDETVEIRLALAQRYLRYLRDGLGGDAAAIWPSKIQRSHLTALLRVSDARNAGLTSREIARHVIGSSDAGLSAIEWKSASARRRVYRLLAESREMTDRNYRRLLAGMMSG